MHRFGSGLKLLVFTTFSSVQYSPSATAVIEIMSNQVQIYSSQLNIHADFTGIRYDPPTHHMGVSDDKRRKLIFDVFLICPSYFQQILVVQLPSPVVVFGCGHQLHLPQCHLHPQLPETAVHSVFRSKPGESKGAMMANHIPYYNL